MADDSAKKDIAKDAYSLETPVKTVNKESYGKQMNRMSSFFEVKDSLDEEDKESKESPEESRTRKSISKKVSSVQMDEFQAVNNSAKKENIFESEYYDKTKDNGGSSSQTTNLESIPEETPEANNDALKTDPRLKEPFKRLYFSKKDKNSSQKPDYQAYMFKVIMIGNIAVGKTCLLSYFMENKFNKEYSCTVGIDFKIKTIVLSSDCKVDMQIWDTSGEERFKTITRQYYRDAAGIVLVFDVTNEKSFTDITNWMDDINTSAKRSVNIVLVGNKTDLIEKRCVSFERANRFAQENNIEYYESSAKTGHQVVDIYRRLAMNMVNTLELEEKQQVEEEKRNAISLNKQKPSNYNRNPELTSSMASRTSQNRKKNCC